MNEKVKKVIFEFVEQIKNHQFKKGQRIFSEREWSKRLNISRAQFREILRTLEIRDLVKVKRGSGIYLNCVPDQFLETPLRKPVPAKQIQDLLEFMECFYPIIVGLAAQRIKEFQGGMLEMHLVGLSRGILEKNLDLICESDREFFTIIGKMVENDLINATVLQVIPSHAILWKKLLQDNTFFMNTIFAEYVGLLNTLKKKDPKGARSRFLKIVEKLKKWDARGASVEKKENYSPENT